MIRRWITPQVTKEEQPTGFDSFELRLGDIMRGERATLSKSLLDVQRELKIKATYIAAIENCDITTFETPSFIAGYVRSYARYLGMDPDWAFKAFCAESGFEPAHGLSPSASVVAKPEKVRETAPDPLANPNASYVPRPSSIFEGIEPGAVGSVAVLVGIVGIRIWLTNHVDFAKPVNQMTAAIPLIIGIADFTWQAGSLTFTGIALGSIAALVVYHGMNGLGAIRRAAG